MLRGGKMQKAIIKKAILVCVLISILLIVYGIFNLKGISKKAITVNATPITNKIIVLDARTRETR